MAITNLEMLVQHIEDKFGDLSNSSSQRKAIKEIQRVWNPRLAREWKKGSSASAEFGDILYQDMTINVLDKKDQNFIAEIFPWGFMMILFEARPSTMRKNPISKSALVTMSQGRGRRGKEWTPEHRDSMMKAIKRIKMLADKGKVNIGD